MAVNKGSSNSIDVLVVDFDFTLVEGQSLLQFYILSMLEQVFLLKHLLHYPLVVAVLLLGLLICHISAALNEGETGLDDFFWFPICILNHFFETFDRTFTKCVFSKALAFFLSKLIN